MQVYVVKAQKGDGSHFKYSMGWLLNGVHFLIVEGSLSSLVFMVPTVLCSRWDEVISSTRSLPVESEINPTDLLLSSHF